MTTQTASAVDDIIRDIKQNPGVSSYAIMSNDGIVIKYESMSYQMALQCAHEVLYLFSKARKNVRELLDPSDNEIDSIRLRTDDYEMIVVQKLNYTIIVIQESPRALLLRQEQQTIADAGIVEEKHDS